MFYPQMTQIPGPFLAATGVGSGRRIRPDNDQQADE